MQEIRSNIWLIGCCLLGSAAAFLSFGVGSSQLTDQVTSPSDAPDAARNVAGSEDRALGSPDPALFLVENVYGDSIADQTGIPSDVVGLSEPMRRLHETALISFEFAPNFGYMRMPPVIQESAPPSHVPLLALDLESLDKSPGDPSSGDPKPSSAWMWINEMTGICANGFVYRPSKVHVRKRMSPRNDRVDRLVYGYPDPKSRSLDAFADELSVLPDQTELWRISSIELIGLWHRESPVVFEQRPTNGFGNQAVDRVPTRSVNPVESAAIPRLQDNAQLVASFDEETAEIRMVGAIRAKQSCILCHDTTEGSLLGAFTYSIKPLPWPEELVTK